MGADHSGQTQPAASKLFEDGSISHVVQIETTIRFRDIRAEQPKLLHAFDKRMRVFVTVLHLRRDRHDLAVDERPDRPNYLLLLA